MKRREVLASLGALGAFGAAGCIAGDEQSSPGGNPDDDTTTSPPTTEPPTTDDPGGTTTPDPPKTDDPPSDGNDDAGWGPDSTDPFQTLAVGTRDGVDFPDNNKAHPLRIWNGADESRSLTLTLNRNDDVALERTLQFPADGWLRLTLNEPATYQLAVAIDGEFAGTVTVDRGYFDCNSSRTNVAVNAEGAVDSTTISTTMACPGPAVTDTAFVQKEGDCGTGDQASVSFEDGAVVVDGAVQTPNPCYDLRLKTATLEYAEEHGDGDDDVLVVEVATDGQRDVDAACVECIGQVGYEASVAFDHQYPSNVRVVHSNQRGRQVVTDVSQ